MRDQDLSVSIKSLYLSNPCIKNKLSQQKLKKKSVYHILLPVECVLGGHGGGAKQ